jgi:CheY-like chemotaxis protein
MPAERPQVLVVDDEPGILNLLELALPRWGFTVLTASSGEQAVELCRQLRGTIDAVLLDVNLGKGMDGPQTWLALRELDPSLKGAFMTGASGRYTPEQFLRLGASAVVHKPFPNLNVLRETLRDVLGERAAVPA